jgi:type VII secretion protein EccCb
VTAAALLYRPERVQFYCVAASGPQLARVADLPHVATVVAGSDSEGVNRVVATLESIVSERDRVFTTQRLDMDKVRAAKFGLTALGGGLSAEEAEAAQAVPGGEVVLIVDGWKNFNETYPDLGNRVAALMRARNYGVRVVYSHTSSISGISTSVRSETGQILELKLIQEHDTSVKRNPADPERNPVREVPDIAGRGLTPQGSHLMVGAPVLASPPQLAGEPEVGAQRLEGDDLSAVVRRIAGVDRTSSVARLPEKVLLEQVFAGISEPLPAGVVPFGLAESNLADSPLVTASIDFVEEPHVVATGVSGCGMTSWLRAMMLGIMRSYTAEEATIVLIEQRRANIGVVPPEWLSAYAQNPTHIEALIKELTGLLESRRPPATATPEELATKRFWEGREIFVVIDGITSWGSTMSPLAPLAPLVGDAQDLGLHIVATADIRQFGFQAQGVAMLGRIMAMQPPVLVMNGHRTYGAVVPGVYAEPQREGKGRLVTRQKNEGVLVGYSEPPVVSRRR